MTGDELLAAWEIEEDTDLGELVAAAQDGRLGEPGLRLRLLASRGDSITVQQIHGRAPHPEALVYVERRGTYTVARCERWPGERELLLLKACLPDHR